MSERTPKRIQRRRSKGWKMPEGAVYVGRPTKLGNPFRVDYKLSAHDWYCDWRKNVHLRDWPVADPSIAVRAFREVVAARLTWVDVVAIRGKDLACWCPLDQPCHADVLLELANAVPLDVQGPETAT